MSTNAAKMSLEERLVQHLKDDTLARLLGDEDAITELVRRAVKEAFFQPQRVQQGSGWNSQIVEKDSIVVDTARSVAREIAKGLVDEILKDDDIRKAITEAVIVQMPEAIRTYANYAVSHTISEAVQASFQNVSDAMKRGMLRQP